MPQGERSSNLSGDQTEREASKMSLLELFCAVDDFWMVYAPQYQQQQLSSGVRQRQRAGQLHESEIMTIMIHFHQSLLSAA